jgi:hypothetical protein
MVVRRPDPVTASRGSDNRSAVDFYRQEWAGAVRLAWLLTGNRWAAEDLAQDAFVAMSNLGHVENPRAYLRTALVNASRSRFRRLAVERRYRADPMPATLQPEFDDLLVAIRKISERQRTALILRYYADLLLSRWRRRWGAPAGLRSGLEWTHASRLRHVLDVLGHRNGLGAALGRFLVQLISQCCCILRRWWADMAGSSFAGRPGQPAALFDQLSWARRMLVGRLEKRVEHLWKPTLQRHPLHLRRR